MIVVHEISQTVELSVDPTTEVINIQVSEIIHPTFIIEENPIYPEQPTAEGNNIAIVKSVRFYPLANFSNITLVTNAINALPAYTVNEFESLWIKASQLNEYDTIVKTFIYKIIKKGKGTYGLGQTSFTKFDLLLVDERGIILSDIINDETTVVVDLGEHSAHVIEDVLNTQNPSITIQDQSLGQTLFNLLDNGITYSYLWLGEQGAYGLSDLQSTAENFQLLSSNDTTNTIIITPYATFDFVKKGFGNPGTTPGAFGDVYEGWVSDGVYCPFAIYDGSGPLNDPSSFEIVTTHTRDGF